MGKRNYNEYKVLLTTLLTSLAITGVSFLDNFVWNAIIAVLGIIAYFIVGALYSVKMISNKKEGKDAYAIVFSILVILGFFVYQGITSFQKWILSWPIWIKVSLITGLVVSTIFITIILLIKKKISLKFFKLKYVILSVSLLLSCFLTIVCSRECLNNDIGFGLFTGVAGSLVVTLLLEGFNDFRYNKKRKEEKELLFDDLKRNVKYILSSELYNYSYCRYFYLKTLGNNVNEIKIETKDLTIAEIFNLLDRTGSEINKFIIKEIGFQLTGEQVLERNKYLFTEASSVYRIISKYANEIVLNKMFYKISETLKEKDICEIKELAEMTQKIANLSDLFDKEKIIEHKEQFFKKVNEIAGILNIDINEKLHAHIFSLN